MANRYGNLDGGKRIRDDFTTINTGFDKVQGEMDQVQDEMEQAQSDIQDLTAVVDAHKADNTIHWLRQHGDLNGSAVNYNTLFAPGLYSVLDTAGATGAPPGAGWGLLLILSSFSTGYTAQIFIYIPDPGAGTYIRTVANTGSTWSAWRQLTMAT